MHLTRRLVIVMLIIMGLIAVFQRKLMYPAARAEALPVAGFPWLAQFFEQRQDVRLKAADGVHLGAWHLQRGARPSNRLILLFHGNAGHRAGRTLWYEVAASVGCDVLAIDYRGYGDSEGGPTEKGLILDSEAAWEHATGTLKFRPEQILIAGESLGGGVAVQLAAKLCRRQQAPAGLVLLATFDSMLHAALHNFPWLPVRRFLLDRYHSDQHIADVTCPLLQFHGDQDTIVPLKLGRRLSEMAPPASSDGRQKVFRVFPGAGHNNLLRQHAPQIRDEIRRLQG
jgi:pimeloyl-ACP methyl ester carboxylesterase